MHPELEQIISKGIRQTPQEITLVMDPHAARHVHEHLSRGIQEMTKLGRNPILLCSPMIRLGLKRFYAESFLLLRVIAYNEISPKLQLEPVYSIPSMNLAAAA
jgi:flagellar biosynthesis protein FlhA